MPEHDLADQDRTYPLRAVDVRPRRIDRELVLRPGPSVRRR
ncbi:hypothetical protein LCL61_28080 [Amycolatopsis coloradensis]|uniref:Uncharacterized protein n=1 Tax=Amycolatopsis coloradensis TaxID=76021 RepID=A0ACD5BJE1_9PSEU